MQPHKLKMYIRNLEGLVKNMRDQQESQSDYVNGMNSGMRIAADSLEMEINFMKRELMDDAV